MKKLLMTLIIGMIDFVLLNQYLLPALGCGSTLGEALAFLAIVLLGMLNFSTFKKLYKTK